MAVNSWRGDLARRGDSVPGPPPSCLEFVGWVERSKPVTTPAVGFAEFIIGPATGRTRWLNPPYAPACGSGWGEAMGAGGFGASFTIL